MKNKINPNQYPELNKLLSEIKQLLKELIVKRKKIIILSLVSFVTLTGILIFLLIENTPLLWQAINREYRFHFKTQVWAKLAAPVAINIPIDEVFKVPFKDTMHFSVPFKTTMPMPIDQRFNIPIIKPITVHVDQIIPIEENVHINTVLPMDTVTNVTIFGVSKDVRIKSQVPVDTVIPVKHDFHINRDLTFEFAEPVNIYVKEIFKVPVDVVVNTDFPVDMILTVPMKFNFNTSVTFDEKLPIIVEFDIVITPFKGVYIEGVKIEGDVSNKPLNTK